MSETANTFGVNGYVDILLVDKETKKVVKHIRKQNHLTEAFARWLFAANLSGVDEEARSIIAPDVNHPKTAFFKGLVLCNPISYTLGSYPRLGYQCQAVGSKGAFQMFLLNSSKTVIEDGQTKTVVVPINVNANTEIAPHLDSSLKANNNAVVVYYGTHTTDNSGAYGMGFDNRTTRWNGTGQNPSFTCSYVKNDGEVTITSVLLAGITNSGHVWAERSAPLLPAGSEATWNNRTENTSVGTEEPYTDPLSSVASYFPSPFSRYNQNYWDGQYVLYPFKRVDDPKAKDSYGLYAISATYATPRTGSGGIADGAGNTIEDSSIQRNSVKTLSYYDLGTNTVYSDPASDTEIHGTFTSAAKTLLYFSGGIVMGFGTSGEVKIIKVRPKIENNRIKAWLTTSWPDGSSVNPTDIYSISIEGTAVSNTAPVMVPRRGATAADDTIEIFFTPEYGTFAEGTGFGLHKIVFHVADYLSNNTVRVTDAGRVAVLPYAIGQTVLTDNPVNIDNQTDSGNTKRDSGNFKNPYCIGAYSDGVYYLPISHIMRGYPPCKWASHDWDVEGGDTTPVACSDINYQPGLMIADKTFIRLGDYVFGHTGERRSVVATDEGYVNLVLNRTRHWQNAQSEVLSGVDLEKPISKGKNEILVVKYTYTLEVYPEAPAEVTDATATSNQSNQISLTFTPHDASFIKISSKDTGSAEDFKTLVILKGTTDTYTDKGLGSGAAKTYKIQSCREACKSPSAGIEVSGQTNP